MVRFGGQNYVRQCPVCDAALKWRPLASAEDRIRAVADQHLRGCPAAVLDPAPFKNLTREQVLAELASLREADTDG